MTRTSRFADRDAAARAVALCRPSIEIALRDPAVSGLGVLHLVVMNPSARADDGERLSFDDAVSYEHSIGDRDRWDVDYADYAREKARHSWLHGMDSRRLVSCRPHALAEGDRPVWGSVWLDGIVVAASGALPIWDEAFSLMVAGHLRAIAWAGADAAAKGA